ACRDVSLLVGHCVLASMEGRAGRLAEAFAQLAEAERLMHIWDVPPVYYLAIITLVKCELWLAQGHLGLANAWLERLPDTYCGERAVVAPELHPQVPLHLGLEHDTLERIQERRVEAARRLSALSLQAKTLGGHMLGVIAEVQLSLLLLATGRDREAQQ